MLWQTVLVLVIAVFIYAVFGGLVFSYLEKNNEQSEQLEFNNLLNEFLDENECVNVSDVAYLKSVFDSMLVGGLSLDISDGSLLNSTRWDFYTSIFVAVELLATIGYSPAAPKTTGGRVFTVFYAFIGIPLFILSVIGFSQLLQLAADLLLRLVARCRYGKRSNYDDEARMMEHVYGRRRRLIYRVLLVGVVGCGLFVLIPSYIFNQIEGWSYGEAVYYCFITVTTVGFGDFIPGYAKTPNWLAYGWYRLAVACWILIVIGWFAGTAAEIRHAALEIVRRVEETVERAVDDVTGTDQQLPPKYVVDQTGNTSVVSVLKGKKKSRKFWQRFSDSKSQQAPGDVTSVAVKSRDNGAAIQTNALSAISTVKVGS